MTEVGLYIYAETGWTAMDNRRNEAVRCACECGGEVVVAPRRLVTGITGSCGCLAGDLTVERHRRNVVPVNPGDTFSRLTVQEIDYVGWRKEGRPERSARCICICGLEVVVVMYSLLNGAARSCGCLQRERKSARRRAGANSVTPGDRFGRLEVLEITYGPGGRAEPSKGPSPLRLRNGKDRAGHLPTWRPDHQLRASLARANVCPHRDRAKFTKEVADEIRSLVGNKTCTQRELTRKYDVSPALISKIVVARDMRKPGRRSYRARRMLDTGIDR